MNIDCIVLAGGQSKRMGRDKAFLPFKNKTFLRNILERLDEFCSRFLIVVNKEFSLYEDQVKDLKSNVVFIKDINPYDGPLNGIVSAFSYLKSEKVLIVTCDTPVINTNLLKDLSKQLTGYDAVIPEIDGKIQPLNTFYTRNAVEKAVDLYNHGKKSLMAWLDNLNYKTINKEYIEKYDKELLTYKSINTPESYKWLLEREDKIK